MSALALLLSLAGCGAAASQQTVAPAVPSTPTPATGPIHVTLTGDTTLDTSSLPIGACGATTDGKWIAGILGDGNLSVVVSSYGGPGSYALGSSSFADMARLASANNQTVMTKYGTITVDRAGKHAHIDATAGFTVPPDYATTTGSVHMTAEITCP